MGNISIDLDVIMHTVKRLAEASERAQETAARLASHDAGGVMDPSTNKLNTSIGTVLARLDAMTNELRDVVAKAAEGVKAAGTDFEKFESSASTALAGLNSDAESVDTTDLSSGVPRVPSSQPYIPKGAGSAPR